MMKKSLLLHFVLVVVLTAFSGSAFAQLPALIDREVFFGNPEISGAQISPNGKFVTFMKPYEDTRNVWIKGIDAPFSEARLLTAETKRPIGGYFWSRDSKFVLFVKDNAGDENYNVYAVDPYEKVENGAPSARNITAGQKVRAQILGVPESDPDTIFVGLNERDPAWHDYYKLSISTGKKTLVLENKDRLQGVVFDNADKLRLAVRSPISGETEILSLDGSAPEVIYSCGVFENCGPVRFHKDNKRVYMTSDKGNRNLGQLVLLDIQSKKETLVEQDPNNRVDFGNAIFSDITDSLIATVYEDDKSVVYWKDKAFEKDYRWLQSELPNREINLGASTSDENTWIISASSDIEPGETYIYDRKKKSLTFLYKVRENLPRNALAEMKPIRYPSSDGLEIPAYLTLPKGIEGKNLPLIVFPHGGPWARDSWGYHTYAQFLANRGYAVLQPNFRASTGYGKAFLNAGNKQWGGLMQDDITWGVKYLVDKGIADPKRVGIMGGSYGGYAALAGVTYTPDTYAASVAIVAPSNLITLLESIPPYWESIRTVFNERMGNPNTEEGKKELMRQSPLTHADKIKTPLMVVQGANDPRVNKRESDQIVIALRDRNYPVEYIVAPDEGHGFARPVNNMAMMAAAEKFLAVHLKGRYQSSMTPEVKTRLGEITVDPKDVTMPVITPAGKAPEGDVSGTWMLQAFAGGQPINITLVLKQNGADVTGTVGTELGNGTLEGGVLSGKSLSGKLNMNIPGQQMILDFSGELDGNNLNGSISGPTIPNLAFAGSKKE